MTIEQQFGLEAAQSWQQFVIQEKLSADKADQFEQYVLMLREWNDEKCNLTRITNVSDILAYHFQDSMRLAQFVDLTQAKGLCDIGSGAGFPGLPLKIMYPELPVVLLEVNNKKIAFLEHVITTLGLTNCVVSPLDWRTFLRQAPYELDIFCARASLQLEQLVKLFKPSCAYKDAQLVYWASQHWQPDRAAQEFLKKTVSYTVGNQPRVFAFFKAK